MHLFNSLLVRLLSFLYPPLNALIKRIRISPGIPLSNPSSSYWSFSSSPISNHGSNALLPSYADIVIIGSGITGASFARTILDYDHSQPIPLQLVMLEARDVCSGATGRNGGHINPLLYSEYPYIKKAWGIEVAKQIIRFRLSHLPNILTAATEENLLHDSQCRKVEAFDVYHNTSLYKDAKSDLATYQRELPTESTDYKCYEGVDHIKRLQLSPQTVGCISTVAGAVHPYRLVTGILSRLLRSYTNFQLFTYTPCTAISEPDSSTPLYCVTTPKGVIQTPHIIHATNAWVSHLVPHMRTRIFPTRGVVTAQRPPKNLGITPNVETTEQWAGTRSFVFFPEASARSFSYLTQQPVPQESGGADGYPPPSGELMLGGRLPTDDVNETGISDDRAWSQESKEQLSHQIRKFFATKDTGKVKGDGDGDQSHMIAQWGGIMGISSDSIPWVGRIPESITGRSAPKSQFQVGNANGNILTGVPDSEETIAAESFGKASARLTDPGEWLAAGYSGEGMVHAWMSARALAYMVLGLDKDGMEVDTPDGSIAEWFPDVFRVSEERWRNTGVEDLIVRTIF